MAQACGVQVLHNTVVFTQPPFAAIEYRFSNTNADLINNLVTHNLMDRGGTAVLSGNLSDQPLSLFVEGSYGDLHLKSSADSAIDKAVARQGLKIIFLVRLSPVFPYNLLNYGLGLTRVKLLDYVLACFGMIPGTFLYVYTAKPWAVWRRWDIRMP